MIGADLLTCWIEDSQLLKGTPEKLTVGDSVETTETGEACKKRRVVTKAITGADKAKVRRQVEGHAVLRGQDRQCRSPFCVSHVPPEVLVHLYVFRRGMICFVLGMCIIGRCSFERCPW